MYQHTTAPQCRNLVRSLALSILLWLLSACGAPLEPHEPVYLRIAGSTSMQPLMEDLAQAYSERYEYVTVDVQGGGSRLGIALARENQIDIGTASRTPTAEDERDPETEAKRLWWTAIAQDGIALVVHPQNAVGGLTLPQAGDMFFGRILDWEEMGGTPGEIVVVSREDGSGTREVFEEMVMREKRVTLTAIVMPSSEAVVEYVARHPTAIGYVSMGYLSPQVKALLVEGVSPMPEDVQSGAYPLTRSLYLLTGQEPTGEVKAFIEFALSPAGQAVVEQRYGRLR
ncbi:MAG: phosphate ABC transporter substrate-binding protein [Anaerolineae bacterium]